MNADDAPITLLIIDDDEVDVRAVTRALRKRGIGNEIVTARDGVEGLAVLRGEGDRKLEWPYLVLLDLNMPRMNGLEFLEAVRQDPALSDTVIFILTTSDDDHDKYASYRQHVAGYVLKTDAGNDFVDLVTMLEKFVITVRFHQHR